MGLRSSSPWETPATWQLKRRWRTRRLL